MESDGIDNIHTIQIIDNKEIEESAPIYRFMRTIFI